MGILSILFGLSQSPQAIADTSQMIILDVRTPEEFQDSRVKGAINIDFLGSDFIVQVQKLDKNKPYKLYCRSGNRSGQAEKIMKTLGFKDVENIGSVSQAAKKLKTACEGKSC